MRLGGRNLKLGVIMSYLWVLIHILANLVYAPLMIRFLGKSEYGLYQVVASFLAYINVLESSLSSGVLRFYCNSLAKGNMLEIENTLAICKRIYQKLSCLVVALGIILILAFRSFYLSSLTNAEIMEGSMMLGILTLNLCVTMHNAVYLAGMRGNERFAVDKGLSCISQILQLVLCVLLISHFHYAILVTIVQFVVNIAMSIVRRNYAVRKLNIRMELHERDRNLERSILYFSGGILLSTIADQIFWRTDQVILAKMYNTSIVAVYAIGAQIYTNYMYAGTTIAGVFFPRISIYYQEENGLKKISDLFIRVGRLAFICCFMVFSGFLVFGKEFISLWVGEDYLPAYYMALVVMIPFTIDVIQHLGLSILQVMDKYTFRAKIYFLAATLNIFLTILLAKKYGAIGAAISTGISMFITSGIIMNLYYSLHIRLDIKTFWLNISGIILRGLLVVMIFYFVNSLLPFKWGILPFILKIVVFCIFYMIFTYYFIMNDYEKNISKRILFKIVHLKC